MCRFVTPLQLKKSNKIRRPQGEWQQRRLLTFVGSRKSNNNGSMSDKKKNNKEVIKSFRLSYGHLALIDEECRLRGVRFSEFVRIATMAAIKHVKNRAVVSTIGGDWQRWS
jgi:hypothetical protein